jgi:hypothetical protein
MQNAHGINLLNTLYFGFIGRKIQKLGRIFFEFLNFLNFWFQLEQAFLVFYLVQKHFVIFVTVNVTTLLSQE